MNSPFVRCSTECTEFYLGGSKTKHPVSAFLRGSSLYRLRVGAGVRGGWGLVVVAEAFLQLRRAHPTLPRPFRVPRLGASPHGATAALSILGFGSPCQGYPTKNKEGQRNKFGMFVDFLPTWKTQTGG